MSGLPPNRPVNANDTDIDNYTAPPEGPFENVDYYQTVMTDYFETMGIPIVEGRGFERDRRGVAGPVAVVNETLVNTFWKDQNPIGQRAAAGLRPIADPVVHASIGVAKDVKQGGVDKKTGTELYFLVDQTADLPPPVDQRAGHDERRAAHDAAAGGAGARRSRASVREADRVGAGRAAARHGRACSTSRSAGRACWRSCSARFAGLALLLAAIGTYGVLSYMVAERRREIGIRMALGADQGSVLAQVMKQGLRADRRSASSPAWPARFALNRLIASLLFGVQPTDPATMVGGRRRRSRWSPRSRAGCRRGARRGSIRTSCSGRSSGERERLEHHVGINEAERRVRERAGERSDDGEPHLLPEVHGCLVA